MSDAILIRAKAAPEFGYINVSYPAGSVLTCSMGSKLLKAKTTTGSWTFAVPKAGSWTVTATQGSSTKSQNVSISSKGQIVSIKLVYPLDLVQDSISGSFGYFVCNNSSISGTTLTMRAGAGGGTSTAYSANKINLTDYKTLYLTYTLSGGEWTQLCVSSSTANSYGNRVSRVNLSQGSGTVSINVAGLNAAYNIGFMHGNSYNNDTATVRIGRLWLEG